MYSLNVIIPFLKSVTIEVNDIFSLSVGLCWSGEI